MTTKPLESQIASVTARVDADLPFYRCEYSRILLAHTWSHVLSWCRYQGNGCLIGIPLSSNHSRNQPCHTLRTLGMAVVLAGGAQLTQPAHAEPPQPVVVPIMQKDLADVPGREMLMITVEYPPGTVEHMHRHDAYAFLYVLEGTIVEQVRAGKEVTLTPGQTFYEGPNDVHTVGRNASTTLPAKSVVVMVKKKGVDAVLPAE